MKTATKQPVLAQMYDKERVREYTKIVGGAIFSREEIVRVDKLESETILSISAEKFPDKILFNGEEIQFNRSK